MCLDGLAETNVSGVVGMQSVVTHGLWLGFRLSEILSMLGLHRIKSGILIEVDAGNGPILTGLTQDVHVIFDIESLHIGEILVRLHIELVARWVAEVGIGTMNRRHQDDLCSRIIVLEPGEAHIDAAAEGRVIHAPLAMTCWHNLAVAVAECIAFGKESAERYTVVIVVGACPDEDGINGRTVGLLHQFRLLEDLMPLMSAAGIDTWLDAEGIAQIIVIVIIGCLVVRIRHRIAQEGATLALPLSHTGHREETKG